jgi:hypothetical protein
MDVSNHARTQPLVFLAIVSIVLLSGCARLNSIHRSQPLPSDRGHILSIDAKQRNVLSAPHPLPRDGNANTISYAIRFCSEPPPDVFTATASTLGLRAATGTEKTRQDIRAELQQTISENAATIERTQTINILREAMYRNCERYLSGAITEQEFIVQAARDQRAMVHVLAIEQLAGTSKAQSTALTTLAKAASSGVTADAIQSLDKAESNAQKTRATAEKARADAVGATPTGACETGIDAYKGSSATPDQITAKKAACNAAEKAESDAKHAASHYATLKNAIDRQTQISSEASGTLSSAAMSAQAASQTTSDAIVRIVQLNNDFNEMEMTCVVLLRNIDKYANKPRLTTGDDQFFNKCIELLSKIIERDKSELDLEISRAKEQTTAIQSRTNEMLDEIKADAEKVWDAIRNDSVVDDSKLTALENEANISLPSGPKNKLLQAKSFEEFQNAFGGLIFKYQKKLGEAASN